MRTKSLRPEYDHTATVMRRKRIDAMNHRTNSSTWYDYYRSLPLFYIFLLVQWMIWGRIWKTAALCAWFLYVDPKNWFVCTKVFPENSGVAPIDIRNIGSGKAIGLGNWCLPYKRHGIHENKGWFTMIYKARQEGVCGTSSGEGDWRCAYGQTSWLDEMVFKENTPPFWIAQEHKWWHSD